MNFLTKKLLLSSPERLKKFKKARPLIRPKTNQTCHQQPNPTCETVPLSVPDTLKAGW